LDKNFDSNKYRVPIQYSRVTLCTNMPQFRQPWLKRSRD